jgi:hypothetical protein
MMKQAAAKLDGKPVTASFKVTDGTRVIILKSPVIMKMTSFRKKMFVFGRQEEYTSLYE